jgi:predicted aspartyl protease
VALAGCHGDYPHGPALAMIDAAAQPALDAWAHAIGGRAAIARAQVIHTRGRIERGGIAGTTETWTTARGEHREDTVLADFLPETDIFDGERGWYVDRNRWVRPLAGVELEVALASEFLDTYAPLLPDRRHGSVTRKPTGEIVVASATGREPITIDFDADGLPRGYTFRDGDKQRRTDLADWRVVDGVRQAFSFHSHDDDPHDDTTVTVDTVDSAPPPPGAFAPPPPRASDAAFVGDAPSVELPIEIATGGIVLLAANVSGHRLSMIVDSGAESSVINAARLAGLGLDGRGAFALGASGGDTVASYIQHVTFELPGVTVRDQTVAAIDFRALETSFGQRIDGVLGYDFLSRFVVEIDYPHHKIRLHDPARYQHAEPGAIAISLEGSTPWVDATITVQDRAPLTGHFTVDTGCTCQVSMTSPFTDANHLLDAVLTDKIGEYAGAGGPTESVSGAIARLQIGDTSIDHPIADFARDTKGATADPDSAGLIGAQVLRKFVVVFDYARGRMWLDPPA